MSELMAVFGLTTSDTRILEIKKISFDPCRMPKVKMRKKLKIASCSLSMEDVNQIQKKLCSNSGYYVRIDF